jgi:hypothetical protein
MGMFDDPKSLAALYAGFGLLSPSDYRIGTTGQIARAGLLGLQAYQGARAQQRQEQKDEVATLATTYKILQDQDNQARMDALFNGGTYTPNPLLSQHEARLSNLLNLSGPNATSNPAPSGILGGTSAPQSGLLGNAPSAPQLPLSPGNAGPVTPGAPIGPTGDMSRLPAGITARPTPEQLPFNGAPSQPTQLPLTQQPHGNQLPSMPELLRGAGIDPRIAAVAARTPEGQRQLLRSLSDAYGPKLVQGVLLQYQPNGQTRFLGGVVGQDAAPVVPDGNGGLSLRPIPGSTQYFANRAGAVTQAQEEAKARNDLVPIPQGDGTVRYVTRAQGVNMTGQNGPPNASQIPPEVIAADRAGPFTATQAPGGPVQFQRGGPVNPSQPGFPAGQSTAAKTAAEVNPKLQLETLQQSFTDNSKANDALMFVDMARKAVNGATTTGLFAKPALLAARVGAAFNITDPAAAADPEVFMAMAGRQVMGVIKNLGSGSGISDADREYAAKAVGGDIKLNKESINRLLDIQQRAVLRGVELHNKKVEQAANAGVPSVFDYKIQPYTGTAGTSVTAPNGRVYNFPTPDAAQRFKQQAGLQ